MFRVIDGKIKIMSKFVLLMNGSNSIYINGENGSVSHSSSDDGSWKKICSYEYNEDTGHLVIDGPSSPNINGYDRLVQGITQTNQAYISRTILYGYQPKDLDVYLEGFAFMFSYTSFSHQVTAIKPYRFVSGRICFDSMFYSSSVSFDFYTAIPASMSCGTRGMDAFSNMAPFGALGGGILGAAMVDQWEWYANATSFAFFYRSHRKYLFFSRNVSGLFRLKTKDGDLVIESGTDSPEAEGDLSGYTSASFKFSMFNLSQ